MTVLDETTELIEELLVLGEEQDALITSLLKRNDLLIDEIRMRDHIISNLGYDSPTTEIH